MYNRRLDFNAKHSSGSTKVDEEDDSVRTLACLAYKLFVSVAIITWFSEWEIGVRFGRVKNS